MENRCSIVRALVVAAVAVLGLLGAPRSAAAQQEAKFKGWTADGQAVVEDVNLERSLKCAPAPWSASRTAPGKGCTPCASKKACAVVGELAAAGAPENGGVKAEVSRDKGAVVLLTAPGQDAPRKLPLRAGRDARVTTWVRPDGKAVAIHVHDAEDRVYVVALGASAPPPSTK